MKAAVAAAEERSAGEIVTIVAGESNSFHDVALLWSAFVAFAALTVLALFPDFYLAKIDWALGNWASEWSAQHVFTLALFAATVKFLAMWLLQLWRPDRLLD